MQEVSDSGHLTSPSNPVSTPKGSAMTPPPSAPSSPVRPSAYRSMSDTRVKKFDKLLGEQVVSHLPSMSAVSVHNLELGDFGSLWATLHAGKSQS